MSLCLGAIVLAGGKSLRMGTDKALLAVNGKTLLQNTCETAQACGAEPILIVTPWQQRYAALKLPEQCEFIDEISPKSPLSGFALGLSWLKTEWVLLLACDLPNLQSQTIKTWYQQLRYLPLEAIAYLPKQVKGWEPLCGFYRSSCLESLQRHLQAGEHSWQSWLDRSPVMEIPNVDGEMLFNCNMPTDYNLILGTPERDAAAMDRTNPQKTGKKLNVKWVP